MFVLKAFVLSIFERPLKTDFTLHVGATSHAKGTIKVHFVSYAGVRMEGSALSTLGIQR